jgi:hypothetical protein
MPYIGRSTDGFGVRNRFLYLASADDTSVSGADANGATLTFTDGAYVDVYLNGVLLKAGTDYNTNTANTIASLSAMSANDEVTVIVYDVFTVGDMVSATSGGTFNSGVTIQTADNTNTLRLISTDADNDIGPVLNFYRNSASPADGDSIGQMEFNAENDAGEIVRYGRIRGRIDDASDGTEDSKLIFEVIAAGSQQEAVRYEPSGVVFNETSNDVDFRVESNGNANMLFVDGGNDRVGIGIGDPDQILELNDQTSSADVAIHFAGNGVDHTVGIDGSNGGFLTISNSATVGTNPYLTFGASTRIFAGAASSHSAIAGGGISIKPTSNTHQLMLEQENGSNGAEGWLFHASSAGGPLIFTRRTGSSDTARFQIASGGDLTATDTDGIGSISDERLKKDIVDFTYSIDNFKKYKPRKFNWKNPELHLNQTNTIGFIAQELEAVDNRFVYETTYYDVKDTDEYKALEKKVTDKTATKDEETTYNEMKLQSESNKDNLDKQYLDADGVAKASKFLRKDAMYVSVIQQLIARIEALESK